MNTQGNSMIEAMKNRTGFASPVLERAVCALFQQLKNNLSQAAWNRLLHQLPEVRQILRRTAPPPSAGGLFTRAIGLAAGLAHGDPKSGKLSSETLAALRTAGLSYDRSLLFLEQIFQELDDRLGHDTLYAVLTPIPGIRPFLDLVKDTRL